MNSKTVLTAVIGTVAGLGLAMGAAVFAQDNGYMGNAQGAGMMGQTNQPINPRLDTHGNMHDKTVQQDTHRGMHTQPVQNQRPVTSHHAGNSQTAGNSPCHADTTVKNGPKT